MSIIAKWDITSRCNLNCKHCCVGGSHYKSETPELPHECIDKIIDDLRHHDVTKVQFVGGEPLLRKNFSSILKKSRQSFEHVTLNTNGLLLTTDWFEENRNHLPDAIMISMDGPDAQSHEAIRGANTFEPLMENIRGLTALVRETEAPVRITLNAILSHSVLDRAYDFVYVSRSLGVHAFGITDIIPVDSALDNFDEIGGVAWEQKYAFLIDLVTHAKTCGIQVTFEATPMGYAYVNAMCGTKYPTVFHCGAGSHGIYIQADGTLYPCMRCKFEMTGEIENSDLVNLRENSLNDFISSAFVDDFINAKEWDRSSAALCSSCKFRPYCSPCMFEVDEHGQPFECLYIDKAVKQLMDRN